MSSRSARASVGSAAKRLAGSETVTVLRTLVTAAAVLGLLVVLLAAVQVAYPQLTVLDDLLRLLGLHR